MSFMKPVANAVTFGAAGQLLGGKKKRSETTPPKIPTMISTVTPDAPRSLIGTPRRF